MNIEIRTDDWTAAEELQHFAKCCAGFELGTFAQQIAFVRIRLVESNPAAGDGRHGCEVEIIFDSGIFVTARALDNDLHVAIYWALEQAGGAVAERLQYRQQVPDYRAPDDLVRAGSRAIESAEANRAA